MGFEALIILAVVMLSAGLLLAAAIAVRLDARPVLAAAVTLPNAVGGRSDLVVRYRRGPPHASGGRVGAGMACPLRPFGCAAEPSPVGETLG